ncbi:peptide ABC transporter ATP-binding protein [Gluconacetobacter sacchari DSM 12717]|uniref:ABC transporter ATP-binding protein n=2 Tax=Gluconacetobacter sacchari TaxID=92759 RepID=A0A7W4IF60_9PROT|nr:ABC transporter ATP-binding protein [Gluconacetobacter sacchari]MBB2161763.1 ABC transporter ATP-binding protein [Gluconacetobacter sacchari]GBQ20056.1 peptide ABC transporter ATP-binding protein [Gluconacetobacter sacchari DSM 12717]
MVEPILKVEDLSVTYRTAGGQHHLALHPLSLTIAPGETLGLVGESGSGKSTLGRAIIGLTPPSGGRVLYRGRDVSHALRNTSARHGHTIQMVFQDPYSSLNPARKIASAIGDVLGVARVQRGQRARRAAELMRKVGLPAEALGRFPSDFSGGQRQRIAIARALGATPDLIIADEPISALDVSVQAQILNLLIDLRRENGLSMLFISHDLRIVSDISDRVAVLYLGRLVEIGRASRIARAPAHPYSAMLFRNIAVPDVEKTRRLFRGQSADEDVVPSSPASDRLCAFAARCPYARDPCATVAPPNRNLPDGDNVLCHFPLYERA